MRKLEANIWKLNVIQALRWCLVMMPTIVLFFQENGLSMRQVLLLQALFSVTITLLEVPSGYLSDRLGRKLTLTIGNICAFLGFVIYSASYDFYHFLAAEIVLAVGGSFISGTDSALIYDTLLEMDQPERYQKMEGRYQATGNFSEAAASVAGGFLALVSLRMPFYVYTAITFLAIPLCLSLVEPSKHRNAGSGEELRKLPAILRYAMHEHPQVKWLIVYASFLGASTLTLVWFIQPYLRDAGLPLYLFGIVWAGLNFSVGVSSLAAYRIENLLGRKTSLTGLVLLIALGYALMSTHTSYWGIAYIAIFYFVRGVGQPVLKDYVNRLIISEERATILSIQNLMARLIFAITGPVAGWISDTQGMGWAFAACGVFFLGGGLISLVALSRCRAL